MRRIVLLVVGVALIASGIVLMLFEARVASLRVCSPATIACEASLKVQSFFESFYSPGGVLLVLGIIAVLLGAVLHLRSRRSTPA
jgi:uncharacterized membrane protein